MSSSAYPIRIGAHAQPTVQRLLRAVSAQERPALERLLFEAAQADGNQFLNATEAGLVADAFERVSRGGGAPLSGQRLEAAAGEARRLLQRHSYEADVNGVQAHFTSRESLIQLVVSNLYQQVDQAKGRRLDLNMMLFLLQADAIVDAVADIARRFPNVRFHILADSNQSNPREQSALNKLLGPRPPNIQLKFNVDFAYVWDKQTQQPKYSFRANDGILHHKAVLAVLEGTPVLLISGSFNFTDTADTRNHEDLVVLRPHDAATRQVMALVLDEFTGFFNDPKASLTPNAQANLFQVRWNELVTKNGGVPAPFTPLPDDSVPPYQPLPDRWFFDVNGFRRQDLERMRGYVGQDLAFRLLTERAAYGRFASYEELTERMPELLQLNPQVQEVLRHYVIYGSMAVSVNAASLEELEHAGFPRQVAAAIVNRRSLQAPFESLQELFELPGVTPELLGRLSGLLVDDDLQVYFSGHPKGRGAGVGFGARTGGRAVVVENLQGEREVVDATVAAPVVDLFRKAPKLPPHLRRFQVAMYLATPTSPEVLALVEAIKQGVPGQVLLSKGLSDDVARLLVDLRNQGYPVEVAVTSKTLHEKMGIVGDDGFYGTPNFTVAASSKNAEARFIFRNNEELRVAFQDQFRWLWAQSTPLT